MTLSKGGISLTEALAMDETERHSWVIGLREAHGWRYVGPGNWRQPQWMVDQQRMADKARREAGFGR